jgi:16S rRNA (uracil1498-N3)-methyltransferase
MHRILSALAIAPGRSLIVSDEEKHHLRVRRAAPGDPIEVLDQAGRIGTGHLETDPEWTVSIDRIVDVPRPPALALWVGAGDRDRFTWMVEKAVELGVTDIVPLDTERSRNVASRIRDQHRDRLERRAGEALKQSGGAWGCRIHDLQSLDSALAAGAGPSRWLAQAAASIAREPAGDSGVTIAIGPEGGFTDEERESLLRSDFTPVGLGPRILRFETAAVAAAAIAGRRRARC